MTIDAFEYATRYKLRFASVKGDLTIEQLWDVPLRSKPGDDCNLNDIAKRANKAVKDATEENFVTTARTPAHVRLEATLEVVKRIIEVKVADEEKLKKRAEVKAKRDKLLEQLDKKQDEKFEGMSETQIKKQLRDLDADLED